jgi:hypothetical protein
MSIQHVSIYNQTTPAYMHIALVVIQPATKLIWVIPLITKAAFTDIHIATKCIIVAGKIIHPALGLTDTTYLLNQLQRPCISHHYIFTLLYYR